MQTLFINIKELLQIREAGIDKISGSEMAILPKINDAFLLIENNIICDFGPMKNCPKLSDAKIIDATGQVILPTWVDSHTHIVYAGNRIQEFVDRINGLSYEEIAEQLDLPLGTVKAQLFRAREFLLQMMNEQDSEY